MTKVYMQKYCSVIENKYIVPVSISSPNIWNISDSGDYE